MINKNSKNNDPNARPECQYKHLSSSPPVWPAVQAQKPEKQKTTIALKTKCETDRSLVPEIEFNILAQKTTKSKSPSKSACVFMCMWKEILSCLSKVDGKLTLDEAMANMEVLSQSKLVCFCGLGLQALFGSVRTFLQDISKNRAPKYDGENDSGFLKRIMDAVAHFLTHERAALKDVEAATLRGPQAAAAKLAHVMLLKGRGDKVPLASLPELQVFG